MPKMKLGTQKALIEGQSSLLTIILSSYPICYLYLHRAVLNFLPILAFDSSLLWLAQDSYCLFPVLVLHFLLEKDRG